MCNRGVSENKLKELENYFDGEKSEHDKTILRLVREYRRQKKALELMRIIPRGINSCSEHVNYMRGLLCDLELGRDIKRRRY